MNLKAWLDLNKGVFTQRDLNFLLKEVLRSASYRKELPLNKDKLDYLERVKRLYKKGRLLPYILGKEEFFGWEFKVNPCVLIPRPETELIVESAACVIKKNNLKVILDLGVGSGNISVSLKKIFEKKITVFSCDRSFSALGVAKENIRLHKVDIRLINTDLFNGFRNNCFDLIVSNPPYVAGSDIKGSLKCEPRIALEAPDCGMHFIKKIIFNAHLYLKQGGFLVLEIGYNHKEKIESLLENLNYEIIDWIKDYSGYWRGVILKAKSEKRKAQN